MKNGNQTKITDEKGDKVQFSYDGLNRKIAVEEEDGTRSTLV